MRVALDAMGGDFAPVETVKGAVEASWEYDIQICLVGHEDRIISELKKYKGFQNISIVHAEEVIGMKESPSVAVRQKKNSSVNVAVSLVKSKEADAVISAGNTGAFMASSLFGLGRIEGIERPAIATLFPTIKGPDVLLLDMGANVDCKSKHLVQFAHMGSSYAERVIHVNNPRVGLLNIGEEAEKGNELTIETYGLLKKEKNINFIGNVEPKDMLSGEINVVVCDGFIGNLILKFGESSSYAILSFLKQELRKSIISKVAASFLRKSFSNLKKRIDYDEYGGALLLGLNGVCIKAHGRAKSRAIKHAIRVAIDSVNEGVVQSISSGIKNK